MLSFILWVVFIILKVKANENATENLEVRLCYSNDGNKNYTVWKDKPLTIVIEDGYPRYVWCRSSYVKIRTDFIPTIEFSNDGVAKLSVENVTAEMSTRWMCTVLKNYVPPGPKYLYNKSYYTAKDLYFNLHVRGARAIILSTNNHSLTYVTTDLSVNYDGEASYIYVEGEDLEISCKKAQDAERKFPSTLRLEYYNAAGILLFKTGSRTKKPHLFRTVLKSDNNNYYLECIRATEDPRREYRYRTTFLKNKGDLQVGADQHVILSVNGQELTTIFNKDSSYDNYIFRYTAGSVLNVTCRKKDHTVRGTLTFYSVTENVNQTFPRALRSESGAVISVDVSTSNLTNTTLICSINNTDEPKPNARILFLLDELISHGDIQGLARNNILYQYTNDENRWTIEYQYSVNETLNLTCVSNAGFQYLLRYGLFEWKFKGKSNDSQADNLPAYPSIKWSQKPFTMNLDATHNTTKLRCFYFPHGKKMDYENSSVELIFRLKPELIVEANTNETTTSAEDQEVPIVAIAVSVGSAIGIITIICVALWRKRIKRTRLIESEYENLSNQNDSPIPAFPSQWETNCDDSHYANIDEVVMEENDTYTTDTDKSYRMPYKRQSNTSENHYTEIDDYFKPKHAGLAVNWNSAHPSNFNKEKDTPKGTTSHKSSNATQNNFCDSKQDTYDKLRLDNLPINKSNENYSNVQKPGKRKTVTFRQMSNDLRPGRNYSEEASRQQCGNNDRRLKQNSDGHYANVSQAPGELQKKPNYENHFLQHEKFENSDYAEPYGDLEISCKNDFYG